MSGRRGNYGQTCLVAFACPIPAPWFTAWLPRFANVTFSDVIYVMALIGPGNKRTVTNPGGAAAQTIPARYSIGTVPEGVSSARIASRRLSSFVAGGARFDARFPVAPPSQAKYRFDGYKWEGGVYKSHQTGVRRPSPLYCLNERAFACKIEEKKGRISPLEYITPQTFHRRSA